MSNPTIVSLAFLKTNWDQQGKSYIDNFVPIVAECIKHLSNDIVTLMDLQGEIFKRFGLNIPQNAINVILKRVRKQGYVKLQDNHYRADREQLLKLNFGQVQQRVLEIHDILIKSLTEFCNERFNVRWRPEDAESALLSYLRENEIQVVNAGLGGTVIPQPEQVVKNSTFFVGSFLRQMQETHSPIFGYFETVVKGNMLANAIFLPDPNYAMQKFKKTEVYFDTSFLIYALGWAGEPRKEPCVELLQLLYEAGANLRCFRHTFEETRGILDALSRRVGTTGIRRETYGASIPTVEYFLSKGYTASDIELLKVQLEQHLDNIRIKVVDKPQYLHEYMIDEKRLDETFQSIHYGDEKPRIRDVDSISAIMRIRRGQDYFKLEDCPAVFVTTNTTLARVCREYFCGSDSTESVSPCLTDYTLTNLLWLKKPLKAPDLPRKRIIADYYAATQPNERLWRNYLSEIERLEKNGQVTTDDYYLLRYSLEAKQALMDLTLGGEEAFTQGTVQEILEIVRSRIQSGLQKKLDEEKELREKAEREIEAVKLEMQAEMGEKLDVERRRREELEEVLKESRDEQEARVNKITSRANKYAKFISKFIQYGFMAVLLIGGLSTFLWKPEEIGFTVFKYLLMVFPIVLFILTIANLMRGTTVESIVRRIEIRLAKWIMDIFIQL
jgi:hypothetical protein